MSGSTVAPDRSQTPCGRRNSAGSGVTTYWVSEQRLSSGVAATVFVQRVVHILWTALLTGRRL